MKMPQGLKVSDNSKVCKLQKSLYGLKQASRQWNVKLSTVLINNGYNQSKSDYSLFTKHFMHCFTAILVYVDDLILARNDLKEINFVKHLLHKNFSIKDLGILRYFLGMEVAISKQGINLYQRKYTLDLLQDAGLLASKPSNIPMDSGQKLHSKSGTLYSNPTAYRRLIGRLVYLTHTRPNISFSVSHLSQFLSTPTTGHFNACLKILRYLKHAPGKGLFFPSNTRLSLKDFSDSDWGSCLDTRRPVTGFCFFIGDSLISWKSKRQRTVSRSSAEAEYRVLALAGCEGQWLSYLLTNLLFPNTTHITLSCDNQSALYIVVNTVFHERTKHIEMDCHSIREKVATSIVHLMSISTKFQLADLFTKALPPAKFHPLIIKLGLCDIHSSACGGISNYAPLLANSSTNAPLQASSSNTTQANIVHDQIVVQANVAHDQARIAQVNVAHDQVRIAQVNVVHDQTRIAQANVAHAHTRIAQGQAKTNLAKTDLGLGQGKTDIGLARGRDKPDSPDLGLAHGLPNFGLAETSHSPDLGLAHGLPNCGLADTSHDRGPRPGQHLRPGQPYRDKP
ncbi:unnamed protein product [Lupinus luteus]|uniref:Reverse transcriptase Ty1/copia-type domain-containing protein n=1 Tax=Lupinus luteus TaxID=3873 RepID=A0AAV1VTA0_LUPLU